MRITQQHSFPPISFRTFTMASNDQESKAQPSTQVVLTFIRACTSFTMILCGLLANDNCENHFRFFLMVGGSVGLIRFQLEVLSTSKTFETLIKIAPREFEEIIVPAVSVFLSLVNLCIMMWGAFTVFGQYDIIKRSQYPNHCETEPFKYAYILLVIYMTILCIKIFMIVAAAVISYCKQTNVQFENNFDKREFWLWVLQTF